MELLQFLAKRTIVKSVDIDIRVEEVHSSGQSGTARKVIFESPLSKQSFEALIQFAPERRKVRGLIQGAIDGFSLCRDAEDALYPIDLRLI